MERRDNDVTNGTLALASLLELGPIGNANTRITPSVAFAASFNKAMLLRRRDECSRSRGNKSIAGAGLESYLPGSITRQLLMQSRLL
jgi:hypothetical protein